MPRLGTKSMSRLATAKQNVQTIMMEVVKHFDIMVVECHRSAERQNELWAKGRKVYPNGADPQKRSNWVLVDKSKIVTYKDGYEKLSRHQKYPSDAIDVVPYPELWSSKDKLIEMRGAIKITQARLLAEGKIDKELDNGADLWKGFDLPHYQEKA